MLDNFDPEQLKKDAGVLKKKYDRVPLSSIVDGE